MRFAAPEWFLLLLPLALLLLRDPGLDLRRPLRLALAILLVLALVRPEIRLRSDGLDLWVLVDRSASASQALSRHQSEWEQLLTTSKGPNDRIIWVDFAAEPVRRSEAEGERFSGGASLTRTALAIRTALSAMESDRAARMLLIGDGHSTEPIAGLAGRLQEEEVALDYRLLTSPEAIDFRIARFDLVERAQFGEPVLLSIEVAGTTDAQVPFEIHRDGARIHRGEVAVRSGRGRIRLSDRIREGGAHRYRVTLHPRADALAGNDRSARWIEVTGGPRLLLATSYSNDPLIGVLEDQGFELDVVVDLGQLHAGKLSGTEAVILNDVPAHRVPADFLAALDFYVRAQGGGLLMTGGRHSFGAGGWFESPIDPLLPVAMDLRQEHRKLAIAMAIVMDRSGSMSLSVPGPSGPVTKMELANAGAAHAIELLGPQDRVVVFAVDSQAHRVVGLSLAGKDREELVDAVARIDSGGGGIFVYEGLSAAWDELKRSEVGQRHVILFSDAADSEEPGDHRALLAEMVKEKTTVSVIGLGTPADADAKLLEEITRLGNGRIFFTARAQELPGLFAQETVAVARSAFIDEPVSVQATAGWLEIAGRPLEWPSSVDGYNLGYLRPGATAALLTTDEYRAPLVAHWHRGLGRVAAVSFPLAGDRSERARAWPRYGDFSQTLARWLAGAPVPAGVAVRTEVEGTELQVELLYGASWEERIAKGAPRLVVGEGREVREIPWQRLGPGRYATPLQLPFDRHVRGAIQIGEHVLPFGPVSSGESVEWSFDPMRLRELRALALASGGRERLNLEEVWSAPRPLAFREVGSWLLVAFLLLLLAEALVDRVGFALPQLAIPRWPSGSSKPPPPSDEPDLDLQRQRRFVRAKKK